MFALKSTVAAAEDSQKVQAQLANALEQQNISLKDNQAAIERRTQALSQMAGFDDELLTTTFINFVRRTGDVTKALNLNAIAVDVARGRNISLEASSALVTRASLGMAGSLRRVGIAAKDGASATELLNLLQQKYAGSAEAYGKTAAGAQERFRVSLENTQEVIGTALLPSITKLLDASTKWLNNTENQAKIQKTADSIGRNSAEGFDILATAIGGAKTAWDAWSQVAEKLPGDDQNGFLKVLLTGNLVDQVKSFRDANYDLARALHLMGAEASGAAGNLHTYGEAISETLAGIAAKLDAAKPTFSGLESGHFQVAGKPESLAQRLQRAVDQAGLTPGTADDEAALRAQTTQNEKALRFALEQLRHRRGNRAKYSDAVQNLSREIAANDQKLAGFAEDRARAAEEAKQKAINAAKKEQQARQDAFTANLEGLNLGAATRTGGLFGDLAEITKEAGQRAAARAQSLTNIPAALALREQIKAASIDDPKNERKLIPFIEAERDAVKKNLERLKDTGKFKLEQLQATLTIAQLNKRIRDIRNADKNAADSFSIQDLFGEGGKQFAAYGSNVAPLTQPLSRQEAGGAAVRAAQAGKTIHITQNFIGARDAAQAIHEAANAARALR